MLSFKNTYHVEIENTEIDSLPGMFLNSSMIQKVTPYISIIISKLWNFRGHAKIYLIYTDRTYSTPCISYFSSIPHRNTI